MECAKKSETLSQGCTVRTEKSNCIEERFRFTGICDRWEKGGENRKG